MTTRVTNVNKRFGSRQWVKLWVNEWLDGTTRFEMSDAQRAFWIDLLAMAGRSRVPGTICAGQIGERFVGYPISRFQSLLSEPLHIEETFELFERTGKIAVEITTEVPVKLYKVELLNWSKYQSEYLRQKKYRKGLHRSDSKSDKSGNTTEVEVDVEREGEREKATLAALPACVLPSVWLAFVEMRKRIRKPLTDYAVGLLGAKLNRLAHQGNDPNVVLEQSVENAWAGVFPLKRDTQQGAAVRSESRVGAGPVAKPGSFRRREAGR